MQMRDFLVNLLEDSNSDDETLRLALRMLLKLGQALQDPEILANAAYFVLMQKDDVSKEIEHFCQKDSEVYTFKASEMDTDMTFRDDSEHQISQLKDNIDWTFKSQFPEFEDEQEPVSQITMTHDAFASDKDHIYNYNSVRGLSKISISAKGEWKEVVCVN